MLVFGFCVALPACLLIYFTGSMDKTRPSILFVLVDTLRKDHLGCYGYGVETTPFIDSLASKGVRFENAVAQSSWTLPSMISLMSGKHIFSEVSRFPDDMPSLAQSLKKRGLRTAAFVANSLVGEKEGFDKGFDHFEVRQHKTAQWSANDLNKRLLPWMRSSLEPPFFLYLHYLDPHFPYAPPGKTASFNKRFNPISTEKRNRIMDYAIDHPELAVRAQQDLVEMRRQIDLYDGEIMLVDQCVGGVLAELKRLGMHDDLVVVITSDHGECLWDHLHYPKAVEERYEKEDRNLTNCFFRDHGYHLFNELIHVPLIFWGSGIRSGCAVKTMVESVDIFPTLLDLAGAGDTLHGDGRSLVNVLRDPGFTLPEMNIIFSHCNEATCAIQPLNGLKMVSPTVIGTEFGLEQALYDLADDPDELDNRMGDHVKASETLLKAIKEKERDDCFKACVGRMDDVTREKMEELGYIR